MEPFRVSWMREGGSVFCYHASRSAEACLQEQLGPVRRPVR